MLWGCIDFSFSPLSSPSLPIQASVVYRFRQMFDLNFFAFGKVGDRSGYFKYPVICSG